LSALVNPNPGNVVACDGRRWIVVKMVDATSVMARDQETGNECRLRIGDLSAPVDDSSHGEPIRHLDVADEEQAKAVERKLKAIEPLLGDRQMSTSALKDYSRQVGIHWTTLYAWCRLYTTDRRASSLLGLGGRGGPGKSRLLAGQDLLVDEAIREHFLTAISPSVLQAYQQLQLLCRKRGEKCPSLATFRRRVDRISQRVRDAKREGRAAERRYDPILGEFPDGKYPLDSVQMDHVLLDLQLVDSISRRPTNRPWLTLALDCYSRMVVGYYLTFESPSALSAGQCIANAILHKQTLLDRFGLGQLVWPCYGVMRSIHLDNAMEFQGESLGVACAEYRIELNFRALGKPNYGGHIERLARTLGEALHALPGTTKSNSAKRGEYASEEDAVLTIEEFETLVVDLIVTYNATLHRGIDCSPLERWTDAIVNGVNGEVPAYPVKRTDDRRVALDFLPIERRTIQRSGVEIDHIPYRDGVFAKRIGEKYPKTARAIMYYFKRDPRDIRVIYFRDPDTNEYVPINAALNGLPACSVWEWREASAEAKKRREPRAKASAEAILDGLERRNAYVAEAFLKTKKARRYSARQLQNRRTALTSPPPSNVIPLRPEAAAPVSDDGEPNLDGKAPRVFDEIEMLE